MRCGRPPLTLDLLRSRVGRSYGHALKTTSMGMTSPVPPRGNASMHNYR